MFEYLSNSVTDIIPIITMLFFFIIFLGIVYWAVRADKKYLQKMKELPLEVSTNNGEQNDG